MDTLSPTMTPGNLIATRNNSVSASFGVGSYGLGGNLLLGFEFGYGWGEAIGVNSYVVPNDLAAVDTQTYSGTFILAGATNLRAITRAVEDVTSVVTTGKPGAKPLPIPLGTEDNGKPETKPAPPK
jgi:hypothetical protein